MVDIFGFVAPAPTYLCLQGDQNEGAEGDPTARVAKIFEQMDTDKDNKLTLAEFKEGSRNDPRIVQALSLQPDTTLTWSTINQSEAAYKQFSANQNNPCLQRYNYLQKYQTLHDNHYYLFYQFTQ